MHAKVKVEFPKQGKLVMNEKVLMNNVQPHKYRHIHMKPSSPFEERHLACVLLYFYTLFSEKRNKSRSSAGGASALVSSFQH